LTAPVWVNRPKFWLWAPAAWFFKNPYSWNSWRYWNPNWLTQPLVF